MDNIEKLMMDAEFILVIVDGQVKVVKNRNIIKRSDLIHRLEEL